MNQSFCKKQIGQIVAACDEFYGTYIGMLLDVYKTSHWFANVSIMACIKYPLQCAVVWPNSVYQRQTYQYASVQRFHVENVDLYFGDVPEYVESIKQALQEAIKTAEGKQLEILIKHGVS